MMKIQLPVARLSDGNVGGGTVVRHLLVPHNAVLAGARRLGKMVCPDRDISFTVSNHKMHCVKQKRGHLSRAVRRGSQPKQNSGKVLFIANPPIVQSSILWRQQLLSCRVGVAQHGAVQ